MANPARTLQGMAQGVQSPANLPIVTLDPAYANCHRTQLCGQVSALRSDLPH
jgi:hypothetical protein